MALLLLWFFLLSPEEVHAADCSVAGTVVDSLTGAPLSRVQLWLEPVALTPNPIAAATTDAAGRFNMIDVAPGRYRLKGERGGYLEAAYGARTGSDGTILNLSAGQSLRDLRLAMVPGGVVAGTVRSADGEPYPGALVVLARRRYRRGHAEWIGEESQYANDLGEYRFHGLERGRYTISVEPPSRGWNRVDHSPASQQAAEASIPTTYPGVADIAAAVALEVQPASRLTGIDVTMLRSRVYRVRGVVAGAGAGVTVQFSAGFRDFGLRTATRNASGEFEMRGVPPGSYVVRANRAAVTLDVASDVDGVRIVPTAGTTVRGHLVFDAGSAAPTRTPEVWLVQADRATAIECDENGVFESTGVGPGNYTVEVHRAPPGTYMKSVIWGRTDALREDLVVPEQGEMTLEILLASDTGNVAGAVMAADGKPIAGATAVLIPERALRAREDRFRVAPTDQNGRFELSGVPPGEYCAVAWSAAEPETWLDPDLLTPFEKNCQPVTVGPKARATLSLKIAPESGAYRAASSR